jgi:hypothetical protein
VSFGYIESVKRKFIEHVLLQFLNISKRSRPELILGTRPRIDSHDTRLINDLNSQIIGDKYLTRQSCLFVEIGLGRKDRGLRLADRTRVTVKDFDAARRTACIAAAPVQDIDPVVLEREHKSPPGLRFESYLAIRGLGLNLWHLTHFSLISRFVSTLYNEFVTTQIDAQVCCFLVAARE